MLCKDKVHACIPLTFTQRMLSIRGAGSEGWDQMRDGGRMEEEYEEEKGDVSRLRAEEERQQVVVRCSTDFISHEMLLSEGGVQMSLQGCPSSRVPVYPPHYLLT